MKNKIILKNIFLVFLIISISITSCNKKSSDKQNTNKSQNQPSLNGLVQNPDKNYFTEITLTLAYLRSYYYDPTKLKPKEMLFAGLNRLQSVITSMAYRKIDKRNIEIQVDKNKKDFKIASLKNLGDLNEISQNMLKFVIENLKKQNDDKNELKDELDDALYGYVNGMLDALDPYSVLIRPKYNEEFQMQTRGAYAGVGMVLSIRDWQLTVINPTPGAPAIKAGIKAKDKIVRINDQSAVNMPLNEAVSMIRGKEGTTVDIWIKRKGWKKPKKFVLTRERIKIQSVSAKLLPGNVAYFRINHFINNTYTDLKTNYLKLKKQANGALKGIILDLWSNPGGLLPQAIYVANAFTDKGMLVATEGAPGTQRRAFDAKASYVLTKDTPLVILISSNSASASEIVTGSLKNLDRALVIGETSYGKGTVQQIFASSPDKPILKLTIRQYLTHGNVSIQQVGVVPQIRMVPIGIIDDTVSLFWPDKPRKIDKRNKHIKSDKVRPPEKPRYEVRYYKNKLEKKEPKNRVDDFGADKKIIETAREILIQSGATKASETLKNAKNQIQNIIKSEDNTLSKQLAKRGINWSKGSISTTKPKLSADILFCKYKDIKCKTPLKFIPTGEKIRFRVKVTNIAPTDLYRIYAITKSPASFLDSDEFIFGKLSKGTSKFWDSYFKISKDTSLAVEPVTVNLFSRLRGKITSYKKYIHIENTKKPEYELFYSFNEVKNGDGLAQKGEKFILNIKVKNIGKNTGGKLVLLLKNHSKKDIFITKGRVESKPLRPGQEFIGKVYYTIKNTSHNPLKAEIAVYDMVFSKTVSRKIALPVDNRISPTSKSPFIAVFTQQTPMWATATRKYVKLGTLQGKTEVKYIYKDSCEIRLKDNIRVFAKCPPKSNNPQTSKFNYHLVAQIVPPIITIKNKPENITKKNFVNVSGTVSHPKKLKDFIIIVTNYDREQTRKKVFFKSDKGNKWDFNAKIPLDKGVNYIYFIARYDKDLMTHKILSIVKEK